MGTTLAIFQISGKYEVESDELNILDKCLHGMSAPSFNSFPCIKSGPLALVVLINFSTSNTSWSVMTISSRVDRCGTKGGREALLSSTLLCAQKYLLRRFAFRNRSREMNIIPYKGRNMVVLSRTYTLFCNFPPASLTQISLL